MPPKVKIVSKSLDFGIKSDNSTYQSYSIYFGIQFVPKSVTQVELRAFRKLLGIYEQQKTYLKS